MMPLCLLDADRPENRRDHDIVAQRGGKQGIVEVRVTPVAAVVVLDILRSNAVLFLDVRASGKTAPEMLTGSANALIHGSVDENVERVSTALQDTLCGPAHNDGSALPGSLLDHLARQ